MHYIKQMLNFQNNVEISKTNNRSLNRPADNRLRVRSFVCKAPNEITTNVSQIADWTYGYGGWRMSGHQRYLVTLRYSRNRIDAYDYVDASCFTSERMVEAHPALYRVMASYRVGNYEPVFHRPMDSMQSVWTSQRSRASLLSYHSYIIYLARKSINLIYLAMLLTLFYDMLLFPKLSD